MTQNKTLLDIDLQLFNEGAGAAAAPASDGAAQQATESVPKAETNNTPGRSRRGKSDENVQYGIQDVSLDVGGAAEGTSKSGVSTTSDSAEAKRAAFKELIEGEYKDQYAEQFQQAFNRRFKEVKGMETSLSAQKPVIDMLMQRYNISDGDMGKLQAALENDTEYYEAAAEEAGMTVEQYKAMQKLERENEELRAMRQRQLGQQQAQHQLDKWYAEAEKVKEVYPSFDFRSECDNRDFLGLLRSGLPVQQAYELMHMEEIKEAAARNAAKTTGEQMKARMSARAARPSENGLSSQGAAIVKSDVHNLTRKDRADIARRVQRGDKIRF